MRFQRENNNSEECERAVRKVKNGGKISVAARECGVKRQTLQSRLKRGTPTYTKGRTLLSKYKETQLVNFIKYVSDAGEPVSTLRVRQLAKSLSLQR